MKKISLLMIAPCIFCSAVWAQVTQVASDSIVLERMNTETRPHTIYAKENLQAEGMIITTAAEEMIEFDYPCWVYFIKYETDETSASNSYLIIREEDGNWLEVNTQNDQNLDDLAAWRIVLEELEEPEETIVCTDIIFSKCKKSSKDGENDDEFEVATEVICGEKSLYITHTGLMVNCAFQKIDITVSLDGNTIELNIVESPINENCSCPVDISYSVGEFETGTYELIIKFSYLQFYSQTINF